MTEHRCITGHWRWGKIRDCGYCCAKRKGKGKRAKRAGES